MKQITDVFVNWQVLLISFVTFALLGLIRALGTRKKDGKVVGGWAQSRAFTMFLPAYPYLIALGIIFTPGVPLPEIVGKTLAIKVLFGVYAGWLPDKSYQLIKQILVKAGVQFQKGE